MFTRLHSAVLILKPDYLSTNLFTCALCDASWFLTAIEFCVELYNPAHAPTFASFVTAKRCSCCKVFADYADELKSVCEKLSKKVTSKLK